MDFSQSSETPLGNKMEKEEKMVEPKTNDCEDKKASVHKNKNIKKSKRNYFQNKKPMNDSEIKIYSNHLENLHDKNENVKML